MTSRPMAATPPRVPGQLLGGSCQAASPVRAGGAVGTAAAVALAGMAESEPVRPRRGRPVRTGAPPTALMVEESEDARAGHRLGT